MFSLAHQVAEIKLPCFRPTIPRTSRIHWSYALAQFCVHFLDWSKTLEFHRFTLTVLISRTMSLMLSPYIFRASLMNHDHLATSTHDLEEAFLALQVVLQGGLGVIDGRVPQHCRRFILDLSTQSGVIFCMTCSWKHAIKRHLTNPKLMSCKMMYR